MRIAFLVIGNTSRSGVITGKNIRYGGSSCSGTESSVIYVAEYLKKIGHDVTIALEVCDKAEVCGGVLYTDFSFKGDDTKEYDVLVSCLWFNKYDELPIKVTKAVVYWYHLAWGYAMNDMVKFAKDNNLIIGTISVSNWAKKENESYNVPFKNYSDRYIEEVIPNSLDVHLINSVWNKKIQRKKHKIIHFGQWSRGGDIAKNTAYELGWDDLVFESFDYLDSERGLDKTTLYTKLAESDYYIFPLLTHGKLVYQDTFSVSVAEALAMGVTVVTYPLGAIPEYFGDYCKFIDFPNGVNMDVLSKLRVFEEPRFSDTTNIIKLINTIEQSDVSEYDRISQREYICNSFNVEFVGSKWNNFLNNLCVI